MEKTQHTKWTIGRVTKLTIFLILILTMVYLTVSSALAKDDLDEFGNPIIIPEEKIKYEYKDMKVKNFLVDVDFLEDITSEKTELELKDKIKVKFGEVSIDDNDLKDKKAKLTFKNICLKSPALFHNGQITQVPVTRTKLCEFEATVEHFSTWTLVDSTWNGTFYNSTVYVQGLGSKPDALLLYQFNNMTYNDTYINDTSWYGYNSSIDRKWTDGQVGTGLYFDGVNDYVSFGDTSTLAQLHQTAKFTVSLWAKMDNYAQAGLQTYLSTAYGTPQNGILFYYDGSGDYLKVLYINNAVITSGTSPVSSMGNNNWNHVVFIGNGTGINFYINGVYYASNLVLNNLSTSITTSFTPNIGRYQSPSGFFNGIIDEVKIFNRDLSSEEVLTIYNNESTGIKPHDKVNLDNVSIYYDFEESSGNLLDVYDRVDGTVTSVKTNEVGNQGNGYYFNGYTSDINIGQSAWTDVGTGSWSTCFWAKHNSTGVQQCVFDAGNIVPRWELDFVAGGKFTGHINTGSALTLSDPADTSGAWHLYCGVFNRDNNLSLYVDGNKVASADMSAQISATTGQDIHIGSNANLNLFYQGFLDDVIMFKRALSATDIANLYYTTKSKFDLSFDEATGNTAVEKSLYNRTTSLTNYRTPDVVNWTNPVTGNNQKALSFDGVNDKMLFQNPNFQQYQPHTVSMWVNIYNRSKKQMIFSVGQNYAGGQGYELAVSSVTNNLYVYNRYKSVGAGIFLPPENEWINVIGVHNGTSFTLYINGSYVASQSDANWTYSSYIADYNFGTEGYTAFYFNGSISDVKILNRSLSADEITELYNSESTYKYYPAFSYTSEVYNHSNYIPDIETNLWIAQVFDNHLGINKMYGRAGDCSTLAGQSYTLGVYNGTAYTFSNQQGECFQYALYGGVNDTESINYYSNVTVESFAIKMPETSDTTINTSIAYTNTDVQGFSIFLINDTDTGKINFSWYVNDVYVWSEEVTGLSNGLTAVSTLDNSYYIKNDIINMTATPTLITAMGNIEGLTYNSNNTLTISNANFNITTTSPNSTNNITLKKPQTLKMYISIDDVDYDVIVTWKINGETITTGTEFNFASGDYLSGLNLVEAIATDGMYTHSAYWNITVEETDLTLPMILGLGIMAFIFVYFAFQLDENHFLLKIMFIFLTLITLILIPATISNGFNVTKINFLRVSYWAFGIFLIYFSGYLFYHWAKKSEQFGKWFEKNQ